MSNLGGAVTDFEAKFFQATRVDRLELTILPTEKCDFRCTYCYEDFLLPRMSSETVLGVQNFLKSRIPTLSELSIEWFGGEPLLALETIEKISSVIPPSVRDEGFSYRSGITTNAWRLDLPTIARLLAIGITRAQVSLDGPKELHDTTRVRAGGGGSFDRIHKNLQQLLKSNHEFEVALRVHLTPENSSFIPDFVKFIQDTYLVDPRFSLLLINIAHLGGGNDDTFSVLSGEESAALINSVANLTGTKNSVPENDQLDGGGAIASDSLNVCYAAKPNAFMIRSDGSLGKCTVGLNSPANKIGTVNEDGTLTINNEKHLLWIEGWFSGDRSSLMCPMANSNKISPAETSVGQRANIPLTVLNQS